MTVRVVGRSNRSTRRNLANNDIVVKTSTTKRVNYLPSVPGPVVRDSSFNNTSLLIHADGTTGANNTVFLDSSSTSTYVPFPRTYSNYFNGSTDYFTTSANASNQLTSDFTIEFWVYPTNLGAQQGCVNITNTTFSGSNGLSVFFDTSNRIGFFVNGNGTQTYSGNNIVSNNNWYHIALVRSGSTNTLYLNGVSVATSSTTPTWPATPSIGVGRMYNDNTGILLAGYLSNVRIVKGTALYTSQFTPPTTALTAITNTQLLTCQSSTFVDNSTNNFTLTQSGTSVISSGGTAVKIGGGRPIQGTFSPFSQPDGYWSNYFSGTTSYITLPLNANYAIGTADFTIEAWVYPTAAGTSYSAIIAGVNYGIQSDWGFYLGNGTTALFPMFQFTNTVSDRVISSVAVSLNQWSHIAVTRRSGLAKIFVNGVQTGTFNATGLSLNNTLQKGIGGASNGNTNTLLIGYISNLRLVSGVSLYNDNFTVPTTPLTNVSGTVTLTCQSRLFVDNSPVAIAETPASGASVQPLSPFAPTGAYTSNSIGGSIYFNNSTVDYISIPSTTALPTATTPFTLECWVYPQTQLSGTGILSAAYPGSGAIPFAIYGATLAGGTTGSNLAAGYYTGSAWVGINSSTSLTINQWSHIALSYDGTTATLYLNGVSIGTYTGAWTTSAIQSTFYVGRRWDTAGTYLFNGYISNVKFVIGKAIYTSTFTPPTSPATPSDAPVLLLNGTNAGIVDQTGKNNITTYGTATVSSTQSRFGGTSMYLDGSTGYLTVPYSSLFDFGTGDFTMEGWFYVTSTPPNFGGNIYAQTVSGTNWFVFAIGTVLDTTGPTKPCFTFGTSGSGTSITSSVSLSLNTWYHIALVRSSGTATIYVNGANVGSGACSQNFSGVTYIPTIGRYTHAASNYFPGYIDDFRITKGIARYTSNFITPTIPVTALLVAGGGGGGGNLGGGGGGGGLINNNFNISPYDTYTVTVGGGGAGGINQNNGTNGSNTSLIGTITYGSFSNTVIGGGGGGNYGGGVTMTAGNNGGSGGGAPGTGNGQGRGAGTGISGQGFNGGAGVAQDGAGAAGGGGGSANTGGAAAANIGGAGGDGAASNISGTLLYYAGGGGGGGSSGGTVSATANGGATASGSSSASNALTNSGGGGGGVFGTGTGGSGGSGIAIISYSGGAQFTGGTITTVGSSTVHTFTTSGTLTPISSPPLSSTFNLPVFPDQ